MHVSLLLSGPGACLLVTLRADHICLSDGHISGWWMCFQMELEARHADNFPPSPFLYLSPSLLLFLLFPSRAAGSRSANGCACQFSRFMFLQLVGFCLDNEKTMLCAILRHPFGCGYGCVWCLISAYLYLRSSHLSVNV